MNIDDLKNYLNELSYEDLCPQDYIERLLELIKKIMNEGLTEK